VIRTCKIYLWWSTYSRVLTSAKPSTISSESPRNLVQLCAGKKRKHFECEDNESVCVDTESTDINCNDYQTALVGEGQEKIFKPKSASSILQALSCRFFGCNLIVFVFLAFKVCLCFVKFNPPPRDFSKYGRARFRQRQARGFWLNNPSGKSPRALCTNQAILDFHFLEITRWLGIFNLNRQNRQERACRNELADLGLHFLS